MLWSSGEDGGRARGEGGEHELRSWQKQGKEAGKKAPKSSWKREIVLETGENRLGNTTKIILETGFWTKTVLETLLETELFFVAGSCGRLGAVLAPLGAVLGLPPPGEGQGGSGRAFFSVVFWDVRRGSLKIVCVFYNFVDVLW